MSALIRIAFDPLSAQDVRYGRTAGPNLTLIA